MKKIVPFKKEIIFKTSLFEITSISLDHNLEVENHLVKGNLIISGEYKMLETSVNEEKFNYELPFQAIIDEKYLVDDVKLDIDDFYYEIINNNILSVSIDISIDNLEEDKRCIEEEKEEKEEIKELFTNVKEKENEYQSYTVYIVRESDTVESIIQKYTTTKEQLEEYNDLSELKIGDKIIIPS